MSTEQGRFAHDFSCAPPIVVGMETARTIDPPRAAALRVCARGGARAARTIDRYGVQDARVRASHPFRHAFVAALLAGAPLAALLPTSIFLRPGAGAHVDTVSLGAIWGLPWQGDFRFGRVATSVET